MENLITKCLVFGLVLVFCSIEVNGQCSLNENCIDVRSCPSIIKLLEQNPLPPQDVQRLKNSQCGYNYASSQPKVCCPRNINPTQSTSGVQVQSDLLPNAEDCGLDPSKRIVGGQLTLLNQFPWLTLLNYQKPTGNGFSCGGSLINNRYIITAAHCILRIPRDWRLISVRLGEHNLGTDPDCTDDRPGFEDCADSPIDIPIEKVIVHEQYNPNRVGQPNDIALIRLSRPVSYTQSVQPICLPTSSEFLSNNFTESSMVVTGFGRTENRSQSTVKLKVELPVKSQSYCSGLYQKHGVTLKENQFCAGGNRGEDSCTGDSGGPLMHLRQTDLEYNWYLYGIVSFGPIQCGAQNFPGIYTNVPRFMPWIINNIKP